MTLGPADAGELEAARLANSRTSTKRLQIGIGREARHRPEAAGRALTWEAVAGGRVAQWRISSSGARALRIGIEAARLPSGAEVRFAGDGGMGTVFGPFASQDIGRGHGPWWSPVLEGDVAVVELFEPDGGRIGDWPIAITQVSHLFASPLDADIDRLAKVGGSQSCEVDLICRSADDPALATVGKAVARMTFTMASGVTALCTGTLLNPLDGTSTPYYFTAAHCIGTQEVARTLTTHWFYDRTACGSGGENPGNQQLPGGATLLYANGATDASFLRLDRAAPAGATFAGWDSTAPGIGIPLTAVHHPAGDVKKVSLGNLAGFAGFLGDPGSGFLDVAWQSTATGVTEPGSSGSGAFSALGSPASDYLLRGGLHGGPSSCTASGPDLRDYYSRFDLAYPFMAPYLDPAPSCPYALSPESVSMGAGGGQGSIPVSAPQGCSWAATSSASWISTGSLGTGDGTASYAVAANPGVPRNANIVIAGKGHTVFQQGSGYGTFDAVANGGFEFGSAPWVEMAPEGVHLVRSDASVARAGNYFALMGGRVSADDVLHQDVAIPADATMASLRFWYRIAATESGQPIARDTLEVSLRNPSTNELLAEIAVLSNLDATSDWLQSPGFDLSSFRGHTVRLAFRGSTDASSATSFLLDVIEVEVTTSADMRIPRLVNLASRARVQAGDDIMIAGFVVGGDKPRRVLVTARGPSLAAAPFDVPGTLSNPQLQLFSGATQVDYNDDWQSRANWGEIPPTMRPPDAKEAAILTTLAPGAYTAFVTGVGGDTGVAIVEVFEVGSPELPLVNLSTRARVQTGDDVLIAGFIIQGDEPKTVLVTARGPSLAGPPFNVPGTLADPQLQLFSGATQIDYNDDWRTRPDHADIPPAQRPGDDKEAAILVTLPPGAYTAIVTGVGGTSGIAIVEVFAQ